jgi:ketosteroid isomerase-like protein
MNPRTEEELLKTFETFRIALFTHDRQKLDQIIAPDYRGYTIYGTREDRETILEIYGNTQIQLDKYDVHDLQAEVIGEIGILSGHGHIRGSYDGDMFEHHVRFMDIFRLRESNWQLYITHITEIK